MEKNVLIFQRGRGMRVLTLVHLPVGAHDHITDTTSMCHYVYNGQVDTVTSYSAHFVCDLCSEANHLIKCDTLQANLLQIMHGETT